MSSKSNKKNHIWRAKKSKSQPFTKCECKKCINKEDQINFINLVKQKSKDSSNSGHKSVPSNISSLGKHGEPKKELKGILKNGEKNEKENKEIKKFEENCSRTNAKKTGVMEIIKISKTHEEENKDLEDTCHHCHQIIQKNGEMKKDKEKMKETIEKNRTTKEKLKGIMQKNEKTGTLKEKLKGNIEQNTWWGYLSSLFSYGWKVKKKKEEVKVAEKMNEKTKDEQKRLGETKNLKSIDKIKNKIGIMKNENNARFENHQPKEMTKKSGIIKERKDPLFEGGRNGKKAKEHRKELQEINNNSESIKEEKGVSTKITGDTKYKIRQFIEEQKEPKDINKNKDKESKKELKGILKNSGKSFGNEKKEMGVLKRILKARVETNLEELKGIWKESENNMEGKGDLKGNLKKNAKSQDKRQELKGIWKKNVKSQEKRQDLKEMDRKSRIKREQKENLNGSNISKGENKKENGKPEDYLNLFNTYLSA